MRSFVHPDAACRKAALGLLLPTVPRFSLLLVLIVTSSAGCAEDREPREWRAEEHQEPSAEPDPSQSIGAPNDEASIAQAAAALYRASCASCHGVDGSGDGPGMPSGAIVDLRSVELQDSRSDEELHTLIRDGRGLMPGFGSEINARGIDALVGHVRSLRAQ